MNLSLIMIKNGIYPFIFIFYCFFVAQLNAQYKPNILIIIADDSTFSDLPLYGGSNVKTSEIDKLAAQGMTFNNLSNENQTSSENYFK